MESAGVSDTDFQSVLAGLWQQWQPRALERIAVLEDAVAAATSGALADDLRERARGEAHRLAGSLGTFGLPDGTRRARELEDRFAVVPPVGDAPVLAELVAGLRRGVQGHAPGVPPQGVRSTELLLVGVPRERAAAIGEQARQRGWEVGRAGALTAGAPSPLAPVDARGAGVGPVARAQLALVDAQAVDAEAAVEALTAGDPPCAVAVLVDESADAVDLVRRGARRLLRAGTPADQVVAELAELEAGRRARSATVLAMDDDRVVLAALEAMLRADGHELVRCADPSCFWETLDATRPDLVLLDLHMPGIDGIQLCRALRADPWWQSIPVVFLTASTDPATVERVFAAGADDLLAKPLCGPEFTTRVAERLRRVRALRAAAELDRHTGLLRRVVAEERLERLLAVAERLGQPLAVAVVRAGGDDGPAAVARVLGDAFGPEEVAASWSDEELLAGFVGLGPHDARERLGGMVEEGRRKGVRISAGLAVHPRDGANLVELTAAAAAACAGAVAAGGDRVASAGAVAAGGDGVAGGGEAEADGPVDIAVVDDDELFSRLLIHALRTRGYRVRHIPDGDEAIRLLGGPAPPVRADLVLLDWDLPARDGLTVLRRLADDGVLPRTRVVMLTAGVSEREIATARELGAAGDVARPFSLPVLMRRIRRTLAA